MCIKKCRLSKNIPNIKKVLQFNTAILMYWYFCMCIAHWKWSWLALKFATHQKSKLHLDCNTLENQTLIQAHGICHFCLFICITCISKENQNIKLALAMNTGKNETLSTI